MFSHRERKRVEKKVREGGMTEWGRRREEKKPSAASSY